jgi:hypothetical protein
MPTCCLAERIRDRLAAGTLPRDIPRRLWPGYGGGQPCAGCDEPILPAQVEYELEMGDGRSFRLHTGCAALLEAERLRRGWLPPKRRT